MQEELTFNRMLSLIIRKWKILFASLIVFVLLFGSFAFLKGQPSTATKNTDETLSKKISITEQRIENQKAITDDLVDYAKNSYLLKINPLEKRVRRLNISIKPGINIDQKLNLQDYSQAYSAYSEMLNNASQNYLSILQTSDFSKILVKTKYKDVSEKYTKEMITIQSDAPGLVTILIIDSDDFNSEEVANSIFEYLQSQQSKVSSFVGNHSLVIMDNDIKTESDSKLQKSIDDIYKSIDDSDATLSTLKAQLTTLTAQQSGQSTTSSSQLKRVIKFVIVGGVIGFVFAVVIIILMNSIKNCIIVRKQLKTDYKLNELGALQENSKAFKIANKLTGESVFESNDEIAKDIIKKIKEVTISGSIALTGCVDASVMNDTLELINTNAQDKLDISVCPCIIDSTDNYKNIKSFDNVIFVEKIGKSSMTKFDHQLEIVKELQKNIIGFIMWQ